MELEFMEDKDANRVPIEGFIEQKHAKTELVNVNKTARIGEEYLDDIINNIGDPLFVKDEQSRIIFVNEAFCTLFDLSCDNILGKTLAEDVSPNEREHFLKIDRQVINTGQESIIEESLTIRGGQKKTISTRKTRYIDNNDKKYIIGVIRDLTERKIAEEKLKETFSRLNMAVNTAKLGVWSLDVKTGEVDWNNRLFEIYGIIPSEFDYSQDAFKKMVHPEDLERVLGKYDEISQGKSLSDLEFRIIRPNNEVRYIIGTASPVFVDGEMEKIIGINQDITKSKKSEMQLEEMLLQVTTLKQQIEAENIYLKEELKLDGSFNDIVGSGKSLKKVLKQVEQVAKTDTTVLILGETGTGKELIARAIHNTSDRKDKPMIKVNCSALSAELIESEFFGHEIGAFTSAVNRKIGRFELANGGTIFLDEIGDLPLGLQTRLLRVLQEREFERVGGEVTIKVDVRVIAATNRNLKEELANGDFRQDLYYRLNVFPITCPPLRERIDDIPILVSHFVNKYNHKVNKKIKTVSQKSLDRLIKYKWPGNVREFEHVIERAVILNQREQLRLGNWFMDGNLDNVVSDGLTTLEIVEHDYIIKVLEKTNWKIRGNNGASEILGLKPTTLESRMKKMDIRR